MSDTWTTVTYQKVKKPKVVDNTPIKTTPINNSTNQNKIIKKTVQTNLHKIDNETDTFVVKRFGSIGKTVTTFRVAAGLTQEQLAKKMYVQIATIKNVENGTAVYDGSLLNKLKQELKFK
jgi:ribosome-binding protein aMBF1 (putative translation factor)